ncbi:MAG: DUF2341 domain-containing protein [Candidatus Sungbacteria bacterium]|nr:DUF2341 domain-containing protein [Candidatus Sungbacteria bacterium]
MVKLVIISIIIAAVLLGGAYVYLNIFINPSSVPTGSQKITSNPLSFPEPKDKQAAPSETELQVTAPFTQSTQTPTVRPATPKIIVPSQTPTPTVLKSEPVKILPNWQYRKLISISSATALSNYQILISLDTASLVSAGKMRSDCGDMRFTDFGSTVLLNYWMESGCNSENSKIWVKVPSITAPSGKIYLYYGNASASFLSNGQNTFLAFGLKKENIISANGAHTCALLSSGGVKCWGQNDWGQLGYGSSASYDYKSTPVAVSGINNAMAVSAGWKHTCALLSGGNVKCWGYNLYGQLGIGTDGYGTSKSSPVLVSGINDAIAIAAGWKHTCTLLSNGSVKCWGENSHGQLGDGTTVSKNTSISVIGIDDAVALIARGNHTCALLSNATVKCWGWNTSGQLGASTKLQYEATPVVVSGLNGVSALSAGESHTCALLTGGTIKCWGDNGGGQLNGGSISNATSVVVGSFHTCALLSSGQVKCWGGSAGGEISSSAITNAVAIAAGVNYSCALLSNGEMKCWGGNETGQLGDGTGKNQTAPVSVLNYNIGGRYDKTRGIDTIQNANDIYFIRKYASVEPTINIGQEENIK